MSLNRSLLKIWLASATCLILLAVAYGSGSTVPCTPCGTWGAIKCCFEVEPCACCECTKDIQSLYYYYLYYLQGDPSISPNDIRAGKYHAAYEMWSLQRLANQAAVESATWGAIKSLFSEK